MDAVGRYPTRQQRSVLHEDGANENSSGMMGKRALRQSMRTGNAAAKRALGDITNNIASSTANGAAPRQQHAVKAQTKKEAAVGAHARSHAPLVSSLTQRAAPLNSHHGAPAAHAAPSLRAARSTVTSLPISGAAPSALSHLGGGELLLRAQRVAPSMTAAAAAVTAAVHDDIDDLIAPCDAAEALPPRATRDVSLPSLSSGAAPSAAVHHHAHAARRRQVVSDGADIRQHMAKLELRNVVNIDANDAGDPLACSEYVCEIYENLRKQETRLLPDCDYMARQSDISDKMRSILIDWLVDVHQKFKLVPETLYLTVNVVDRFLSKEKIVRQKLQLVGVTSMLIASKYFEIYAPETNDFVYISDRAYTREEILKMEAVMLNSLGFNVTTPSPFVFLARFLKACNATKKVTSYANYCLELTQQEYRLVGASPSRVAAAACWMAGKQCQTLCEWNDTMRHYTNFEEEELLDVIRVLEELLQQQGNSKAKLTAVRRKYSQVKHMEVAKMELLTVL